MKILLISYITLCSPAFTDSCVDQIKNRLTVDTAGERDQKAYEELNDGASHVDAFLVDGITEYVKEDGTIIVRQK